MRKLFKERKLFKGGNYMRKYGIHVSYSQEQIKTDPTTGQLLTADTWDYKPPSCYDIPQDMRTTLCETNR